MKWYSFAAEQGNADAHNNLGRMYSRGDGVEQNYETVVKCYSFAAEQGDVIAQNNLGVMYYYGEGVAQNYETAVKWFSLSAEQGYAEAQNNLGEMYYYGSGFETEDYIQALMWLNISVSNGNKDAIELRDIVSQKMSPEDIAKSQQKTRGCEKKNYKGC